MLTREPKVGDIILATDENKKLQVKSIWKPGLSKYIDFDAIYLEPIGVDRKGNTLTAGRAFRFDGGNWEFDLTTLREDG